MSYSIKVLSNDEFESLPYERVSTSLGVADPAQNTAYIRHSAFPELNKYLIDHEFEHLIEESTDEQEGSQGERYKDLMSSFGNMAKSAGPIVSMFNPGAGAAMTVGGSLASGGGSGMPSLKGGVPSGTTLNANQLADQNSRSNPLSGIMNMFNSPQAQLGSSLLGLGLNKKNPEVPALPQSVENLRSQSQAGGTALGQQGRSQLSSMMSQQFQPLQQPEIDAALRQYDLSRQQQRKGILDLYHNVRPGSDPTSDSTMARDLNQFDQQSATGSSDILANRTRDVQNIFNQQKMSAIQQSLGADESTMNQLAQIAQLDVNQVMTKLQMDYASAQNFKQVFESLGGQMVLKGTNSDSLFGGFNAGGK